MNGPKNKLAAEWFWTDRWTLSRAFHLSLEARGLYREMLSQAWIRGAKLPTDPVAIQRIVGATADEWTRAWPFVEPFWIRRGDALINETQVAIYLEALQQKQRIIQRNRANIKRRYVS